jgi:glycosyltransferase involved in cell wall biosynthesis
MKLSILIPTLESRRDKFCKLVGHIIEGKPVELPSVFYGKCNRIGFQRLTCVVLGVQDCEICYEIDNGELSVGVNRQKLLERATGDYICFIDDDDMVPDNYVAKVLKAIETKPDCCSLTGELHWPNSGIERFEHSIDYDKWEKKDNVYLRYPNHLNTVKRELALQVGFKDMRHGEDRDYSDRLKPLLKTEAKIDGVIYHYMMR